MIIIIYGPNICMIVRPSVRPSNQSSAGTVYEILCSLNKFAYHCNNCHVHMST